MAKCERTLNSNFYQNFWSLFSVLCAKRQHSTLLSLRFLNCLLLHITTIDLMSIVHVDKIWVKIAKKF